MRARIWAQPFVVSRTSGTVGAGDGSCEIRTATVARACWIRTIRGGSQRGAAERAASADGRHRSGIAPVAGTISTQRPSEPSPKGSHRPCPPSPRPPSSTPCAPSRSPSSGATSSPSRWSRTSSSTAAAVAFTIELTTPACPLKDEIEGNVQAVLGAIGVETSRHHLGRDGPAGPAAPGRAAAPRASRTSSPSRRARAASARARSASTSPSPSPRRARSVGLLDADITGPNIPMMLGRRGPAEGDREQQDRAARAPRRQGHLDPVLRPRGPADRVARAARRRRHPAVPPRRRLGRARLPRHRPAARHVRRAADPRPGRPDLRRRPRDDAAGGRPVGRRARRSRCSSG